MTDQILLAVFVGALMLEYIPHITFAVTSLILVTGTLLFCHVEKKSQKNKKNKR